MRIAWAEIDLQALSRNFHTIRQQAPNSKIVAVLKANAYGHGMTKIAHGLPEADMFGVARIEEALKLRSSGITQPILLLEGVFNANELPMLAAANIHTVIHHESQLQHLEQASNLAPIQVWLKVDTGMNRLGIAHEQCESFMARLNALNTVTEPVVLMSHMGCADTPEHALNAVQIAAFEKLSAFGHHPKSLANSPTLLHFPEQQYDFVRPGLALYGVSPSVVNTHERAQLAPVMTLKTSLIAVKPVKKGDYVGYGATWRAQRDTVMGIAGIGYGDGYPRHLADNTPVLVNGEQRNIIGAVSMDMINIDLGADNEAQVGDEVTLWGKGLDIREIASHAGTIPYELLCNVTRRVKFRYLNR